MMLAAHCCKRVASRGRIWSTSMINSNLHNSMGALRICNPVGLTNRPAAPTAASRGYVSTAGRRDKFTEAFTQHGQALEAASAASLDELRKLHSRLLEGMGGQDAQRDPPPSPTSGAGRVAAEAYHRARLQRWMEQVSAHQQLGTEVEDELAAVCSDWLRSLAQAQASAATLWADPGRQQLMRRFAVRSAGRGRTDDVITLLPRFYNVLRAGGGGDGDGESQRWLQQLVCSALTEFNSSRSRAAADATAFLKPVDDLAAWLLALHEHHHGAATGVFAESFGVAWVDSYATALSGFLQQGQGQGRPASLFLAGLAESDRLLQKAVVDAEEAAGDHGSPIGPWRVFADAVERRVLRAVATASGGSWRGQPVGEVALSSSPAVSCAALRGLSRAYFNAQLPAVGNANQQLHQLIPGVSPAHPAVLSRMEDWAEAALAALEVRGLVEGDRADADTGAEDRAGATTAAMAEMLASYLQSSINYWYTRQTLRKLNFLPGINSVAPLRPVHEISPSSSLGVAGAVDVHEDFTSLQRALGVVEQWLARLAALPTSHVDSAALLSNRELLLTRFTATCLLPSSCVRASVGSGTGNGRGRAAPLEGHSFRSLALYHHIAHLSETCARAALGPKNGGEGRPRYLPPLDALAGGRKAAASSLPLAPLLSEAHYVALLDSLFRSWPTTSDSFSLLEDVSALSSWLLEELRLNCNKAPGGASGEPPVLTETLLLGLLRLHTKAAQMSNDADHKLFVMNQAVLFINEHTAGAGHGEKIPLSGAVVAEFVRLCCANGLLEDAVEHCRELDELFPQLRQPVVAQVNREGGGDDGSSTGGWKVPPKARVEGGGLSKRMRRQAKALGHELPPLPELPRTSRDRQKDGIGSPSASASAVLSTAEPYEPIFFAKCLRVKQFAERAMSAPAGRSGRAVVDAGTSAAVRELDDMLVLYNELLNKGLTVTPRVVESLVTSCVYEEIAQNVGNNSSSSKGSSGGSSKGVDVILEYFYQHSSSGEEAGGDSGGNMLPPTGLFFGLLDYCLLKRDVFEAERILLVLLPLYRQKVQREISKLQAQDRSATTTSLKVQLLRVEEQLLSDRDIEQRLTHYGQGDLISKIA